MSTNPVQATLTDFYHASERRVVSLQQAKFIILETQLSPHVQQLRQGQGTVQVFNRAREIPEYEAEQGRIFRQHHAFQQCLQQALLVYMLPVELQHSAEHHRD